MRSLIVAAVVFTPLPVAAQFSFNRAEMVIARPAELPVAYDDRATDADGNFVDIGGVIAALRNEFDDRIAGVYSEPERRSRVIVRLTGHDFVRDRLQHVDGQAITVEFRIGASHTLIELQRTLKEGWPEILAKVPTAHAHYASEVTGELVISVISDDDASQERQSELSLLLGVPVKLRQQGLAVLMPGLVHQ